MARQVSFQVPGVRSKTIRLVKVVQPLLYRLVTSLIQKPSKVKIIKKLQRKQSRQLHARLRRLSKSPFSAALTTMLGMSNGQRDSPLLRPVLLCLLRRLCRHPLQQRLQHLRLLKHRNQLHPRGQWLTYRSFKHLFNLRRPPAIQHRRQHRLQLLLPYRLQELYLHKYYLNRLQRHCPSPSHHPNNRKLLEPTRAFSRSLDLYSRNRRRYKVRLRAWAFHCSPDSVLFLPRLWARILCFLHHLNGLFQHLKTSNKAHLLRRLCSLN